MNESDFKKFRLEPTGRILYAPITPMLGSAIKCRPTVLLSLPATNEPEAEFRVAGGSSDPPIVQNEPLAIKVPGRKGGHLLTGLKNDTWFYAGWIRTVRVQDVENFCGEFPAQSYVPFLNMIADWVKKYG